MFIKDRLESKNSDPKGVSTRNRGLLGQQEVAHVVDSRIGFMAEGRPKCVPHTHRRGKFHKFVNEPLLRGDTDLETLAQRKMMADLAAVFISMGESSSSAKTRTRLGNQAKSDLSFPPCVLAAPFQK